MANQEQLAILKRGVRSWNDWRKENPSVQIDLADADLHKRSLRVANFNEADLKGAKLADTNLADADLMDADLSRADLRRAELGGAFLRDANLSEAKLSGAIFGSAVTLEANLRGANLNSAILTWADLSKTILEDTNFEKCILGYTYFCDVDLSTDKGLETAVHDFPSSIGIDTIYKSKGKIPEAFLRGAGVPENLISYMHSLTGQAFEFYSCFISYSSKDREFADRLHADLQSKGVRVWFFSEDAKWGETVWGEIDRSIKIYDKLVVLLSANSLQSGPVLREIERALNREDKESKSILFPVRIDDYVFNQWQHERKADLVRKVIGDFSKWKDHDAYKKSFARLLRDLKGKAEAKAEA